MSDFHYLKLQKDRVVLFADIIGFSNTVKKNEDTDKESNLYHGIMIDLCKIYDSIVNDIFYDEYLEEKRIKFMWVSDSIILSCAKDDINNLFYILNELINCLYCAGFAIRGGISIGSLHHEKNIWGVPLIKAVELEKNHALWPRIILSKEDVNILNVESAYADFFCSCQEKSNKEYIYYDYFSWAFSEMAIKDSVCSQITVYTNFIVNNYKKAVVQEHKEKWQWLGKELYKAIKKNEYNIQRMRKELKVHPSIDERSEFDYLEKLDYLR